MQMLQLTQYTRQLQNVCLMSKPDVDALYTFLMCTPDVSLKQMLQLTLCRLLCNNDWC